jgi:hypothetical protein
MKSYSAIRTLIAMFANRSIPTSISKLPSEIFDICLSVLNAYLTSYVYQIVLNIRVDFVN